MATLERPSAIPREDLAALQEAIDRAVNGVRDPAAAARACEEMDRAREEMRRKFGEVNIAVELIRESRDDG